MTIPQSVLAVALVLVWLVVLVPMTSRRRKHVREVVDGRGFRVLSQSSRPAQRRLRRQAAVRAHVDSMVSEGEMSTQQTDLGGGGRDDADHADQHAFDFEHTPESDGEKTVQLAAVRDVPAHTDDYADHDTDEAADDTESIDTALADADVEPGEHPSDAGDDETTATRFVSRPRRGSGAHPARATTSRQTAGSTPVSTHTATARRPGRGGYDPEIAERDRAFKYARRRRVVLALLVLVAGFAAGAVAFAQPTLWIAVAVCGVLLLLFLVYLRRQVRIEADIRARRLARLERARQIRPEFDTEAVASVPGARPHRVGRVPVDLDDDDPSFDHLEEYEPVEYRRAVGQ